MPVYVDSQHHEVDLAPLWTSTEEENSTKTVWGPCRFEYYQLSGVAKAIVPYDGSIKHRFAFREL